MSYYFATLTLLSPIEVKPRSGANPLSVVLYQNDVPLPVQVPPWLAERLQTQAPEGPQRVVVYPKTDPDGLLNFTSSLGNWTEPKGDEEAGLFHTTAQVVFVDRDEARLVVRIHPNPKGNLRKAFKLTFQTNLELLDKAPKRGQGRGRGLAQDALYTPRRDGPARGATAAHPGEGQDQGTTSEPRSQGQR